MGGGARRRSVHKKSSGGGGAGEEEEAEHGYDGDRDDEDEEAIKLDELLDDLELDDAVAGPDDESAGNSLGGASSGGSGWQGKDGSSSGGFCLGKA